jgi:hypothetical protein
MRASGRREGGLCAGAVGCGLVWLSCALVELLVELTGLSLGDSVRVRGGCVGVELGAPLPVRSG